MRTGKMLYRVIIQKPKDEDIRRGKKQEFEDIATVWASIRIKNSNEKKDNDRLVAIGTYEIRIWTHAEIDPTCRIKHNNHIYNITQIDDTELIRKETILLANRDLIK